jgi:hypothetical protein
MGSKASTRVVVSWRANRSHDTGTIPTMAAIEGLCMNTSIIEHANGTIEIQQDGITTYIRYNTEDQVWFETIDGG